MLNPSEFLNHVEPDINLSQLGLLKQRLFKLNHDFTKHFEYLQNQIDPTPLTFSRQVLGVQLDPDFYNGLK